MSLHLLRECKSVIDRKVDITAGTTIDKRKGRRRAARLPEPEDALKEFGVIPKSDKLAIDYLVLRGITNISIPMLARDSQAIYNKLHRLFRAGRYNEIDFYINEYKKEYPNWRTHTRPHQNDGCVKRHVKKIILTDEQKAIIRKCPTVRAYFEHKGVGNITIKDVRCHSKMTKSEINYALSSGNFRKIDDAIEKFKMDHPGWEKLTKAKAKFY